MTQSDSNTLCHVAFSDYTQTPLAALQHNPRLPKALRHYAATLPTERQHQFLACRALLAELLYCHHRIPALPDILTNQQRPHFANPELPDFNISHSGHKIAVALSTFGGVGLDIEIKQSNPAILKIANHRFSSQEVLWLNTLPATQQLAGFWQLWTMRESILKLCAKGVWQMRDITILPTQNRLYTAFCDQLSCFHQQNADLSWAVSCHHTMESLLLSQVETIYAGMTLHSQVFAKNTLKIFHYLKIAHPE